MPRFVFFPVLLSHEIYNLVQIVPLLTWGNHVGSLAPLRFAPFLVFLFVLPPSLGSSSFLLVLNYGGRRAAGGSGTPSVHCTRISDY